MKTLPTQTSESHCIALVDQIPDVIFSLDADGRFTFVNSVVQDLLGRSPDEVIGTSLWDYVCPDCIGVAKTLLGSDLDSTWDQEMWVCDSSGQRKWVRTRCKACSEGSNQIRSFDGVMRDRTATKLLHQELEASKEALRVSDNRYRSLIARLPDVVFELDAQGCFTFVNGQMENLFGYADSAIIGKRFMDLIVPEDDFLAASMPASRPENIWDEELGIFDGSGRRRWVRIRCRSFLDASGNVCGFEGSIRDRTVRKLLEEELKASKEELVAKMKIIDSLYEHLMESGKARAIAQHTAEVAHELRQPLAIIGGFTRRMVKQLDCCDKLDKDDQKECFKIIIREVQRLEKILTGLIDFTKHEEICLEEVDPNELIEETLHLHELKLKEKRIRLDIEFQDEIGRIMLDPFKFQQVIRNLVFNAIEASDEEGTIRIETRMSTLSERAQQTVEVTTPTFFEMRISNNGARIPPEALNKIFDPFFTTKELGVGVGLTLCKRIVEQHNGLISVKSDEEGTVFTIWIPK